MANRKQRRAQQKLLRKRHSGQLSQVAGLLKQVDDLKGGLQAITDKVSPDSEELNFARLLCKMEDEAGTLDFLDDSERALLNTAREMIK